MLVLTSGTTVGDPIEANAAGEIFAREDEVYVGSVKGNTGLVLQRQVLPPHFLIPTFAAM